jgi:hypothetical protein
MAHRNKEDSQAYFKKYYQNMKNGTIRTWDNTPVKDISEQKFFMLTAKVFSHRRAPLGRPMWKFLCDCGNEKILCSADVTSGKQKTCGCRVGTEKRKRKSLPEEAARHNLFAQYRYNAKSRKLEFSLSEQEFNALTSSNCAFCGIEPLQIHRLKRQGGVDTCLVNGIDRIDNDKGYMAGNVQPCCKICNQAKHTMKLVDFIAWLDRVVEFLNPESDAISIGRN